MKKEELICDVCGGLMYSGNDYDGHSLHLEKAPIKMKVIWWWQGQQSREYRDNDICAKCYSFIKELNNKSFVALRTIYEMYCRMCVADMNEFEKKLFELAKETDRYYSNHPIESELN